MVKKDTVVAVVVRESIENGKVGVVGARHCSSGGGGGGDESNVLLVMERRQSTTSGGGGAEEAVYWRGQHYRRQFT